MKAKRSNYEAPKAEIIKMEVQTVLCGSPIRGNNTESVGTDFYNIG